MAGSASATSSHVGRSCFRCTLVGRLKDTNHFNSKDFWLNDITMTRYLEKRECTPNTCIFKDSSSSSRSPGTWNSMSGWSSSSSEPQQAAFNLAGHYCNSLPCWQVTAFILRLCIGTEHHLQIVAAASSWTTLLATPFQPRHKLQNEEWPRQLNETKCRPMNKIKGAWWEASLQHRGTSSLNGSRSSSFWSHWICVPCHVQKNFHNVLHIIQQLLPP